MLEDVIWFIWGEIREKKELVSELYVVKWVWFMELEEWDIKREEIIGFW